MCVQVTCERQEQGRDGNESPRRHDPCIPTKSKQSDGSQPVKEHRAHPKHQNLSPENFEDNSRPIKPFRDIVSKEILIRRVTRNDSYRTVESNRFVVDTQTSNLER